MQSRVNYRIFSLVLILGWALSLVAPVAGVAPEVFSPVQWKSIDPAETQAISTVSGVVTDGGVPLSGAHGYPLYARIRVTAAPDFDQTFYTDPLTGAYAIDLEQGVPYIFSVTAYQPGYQTLAQTLTPNGSSLTQDFALLVDPEACTAPGYQQEYDLLYDFEASDHGFTAGGITSFAWGDFTSGPLAGHSGTKGIATNPAGNYSPDEAGYMLSPTIDLTIFGDDPTVIQWWDWKDIENIIYDSARMEVTRDGGATWTTVWGPVGGVHDTAYHQQTVILDPLYNVADFQFRFYFQSDTDLQYTGWYIDDIGILGVPLTATTVFSTNFDADNGGFIPSGTNSSWAWGAPTSGPGTANTSPNAWATNLAGDYNASESSYLTSPVIDLSAYTGQIPILSFFQWNDVEDTKYDWGAVEASKDGGATWQDVSGKIGDVTPWSPKTITLDAAYAVSNFRLRFSFKSDATIFEAGWYIDDLAVSVAEPAVFSGRCVPTPGGAVGGYVFDENTALPLVGASVTSPTASTQSVQWGTDAAHAGFYWLFQATATDPEAVEITAAKDLYTSGVETVSMIQDVLTAQDFYLSAGELGFDPASFTIPMTIGDPPGDHTLTLTNSGGRDAAFSLKVNDLGYELPLAESLAGYDSPLARQPYEAYAWDPQMVRLSPLEAEEPRAAGVTWLSLDPLSGTVPAEGSQGITLTLDPAALPQPGDYHAEISVAHDTPYTYPKIPVTLQLAAPADWGRITGIVDGLEACDVNPAALAGATVSFWQGGVEVASIQTTSVGYYTYSLPNGTYDIKVTADGYLEQVLTGVVLGAGVTLTQDFDLRLLAPCLSAVPTSLEQNLPVGGTASQSLTLTNTGAAEAVFEMLEAGADRDAMILYESFEDGWMPPAGWYTVHNGLTSQRWTITDEPRYRYEGTYAAWKRYDRDLNSDEWLVSPVIDATLLTNLQLSFWAFSNTQYPGATVKLWVTDESGTPLTTAPLWDLIRDETWDVSGYRLIEVDLTSFNRSGPLRLAWQYVGVDGESFALDLIQMTGNSDVTWLSKSPTSGVLAPDGGQAEITVGFDATGLDAGDYYGALAVSAPPAPLLTVPITLHILADTTPVVGDIPDQEISLGESFAPITLDDYVTDLDDADDQITWSVSGEEQLQVSIVERVATITSLNPDWVGVETLTFRATDPDMQYSEDQATFTIGTVNQPPVLDGIGSQGVDELTLLTFTATASDPDLPGDTLTFSLVNAPTGAVIDPQTGVFTWTPAEIQGPGIYNNITVKVCDDGNPVLCDQELIAVTVNEVNTKPQLNTITNKVVNELSLLSFTVYASDPDLPNNILTFSLVDAPEYASISTDGDLGNFTWRPTEEQGPGVYSFTIQVCDDAVPSACVGQEITVTVNEVSDEPGTLIFLPLIIR